MKKIGGYTTPVQDNCCAVPGAKSGAGSFGKPVEDAPSQAEHPIKPVQFMDVAGGAAGSKGFGVGKK
jgi:hypothetical protein